MLPWYLFKVQCSHSFVCVYLVCLACVCVTCTHIPHCMCRGSKHNLRQSVLFLPWGSRHRNWSPGTVAEASPLSQLTAAHLFFFSICGFLVYLLCFCFVCVCVFFATLHTKFILNIKDLRFIFFSSLTHFTQDKNIGKLLLQRLVRKKNPCRVDLEAASPSELPTGGLNICGQPR